MQSAGHGHLQFFSYRRGLPSCSPVSLGKFSAIRSAGHPSFCEVGPEIFPANSRAGPHVPVWVWAIPAEQPSSRRSVNRRFAAASLVLLPGAARTQVILNRTLMRPREALLFIRESINTAINHKHEKVTEQDILDAERSTW
jgi:hypothetical protein